MRDTFVKTIDIFLSKKSDLFLITGDLGFGIFDQFEKKFGKRYLNVGVAEQNMIGVGTGIALNNNKVFCYSIANFVFMRNLEQIRNGPLYHDLNLTLVCSGGGFTYGQLGFSHFAIEDYGILSTFQKIDILLPSTSEQVELSVQYCIENKNVKYLRLEKEEFNFPTVSLITNQTHSGKLGLQKYFSGNKKAILAIGGLLKVIMDYNANLAPEDQFSVYSITRMKDIYDPSFFEELSHYDELYIYEEHVKQNSIGDKISSLGLNCKITLRSIDDGGPSIVGDQNYLRKLYQLIPN